MLPLNYLQRYKPTGVYASESQWNAIMGGSSYTGGSSHQLW